MEQAGVTCGAGVTGKIFINYRRGLSLGDAQHLATILEKEFGKRRVFIDVRGIDGFSNWMSVLQDQVAGSAAMLSLISPEWVAMPYPPDDALSSTYARRLDNPQDFVRFEISQALTRNVPVLPVLLNGAVEPKKSDLPDDIRDMLKLQTMPLNGKTFPADADAIVRELRKVLRARQPQGVPGWAVGGVAVASMAAGVGIGLFFIDPTPDSVFRTQAREAREEARAAKAQVTPLQQAIDRLDDEKDKAEKARDAALAKVDDLQSRTNAAEEALRVVDRGGSTTVKLADIQRQLKAVQDTLAAAEKRADEADARAKTSTKRAEDLVITADKLKSDLNTKQNEIAALKDAAEKRKAVTRLTTIQSKETAQSLGLEGQRPSSGNPLATAGYEDKAKRLIRTLEGHEDVVRAVAMSGDEKTIVSGSEDRTIKLWEAATGKLIRTLRGHEGLVSAVAVLGDGKTIVSGSLDTTLKMWEVGTGKLIRTLEGHKDLVRTVTASGDGKTIVSGSDDNTIKLWEVETGKSLRTLEGHAGYVLAVGLSGDGRTIVSGSVDKTIKLWEAGTGKLVRTLEGHGDRVFAVALSRDGKTVVSGSQDSTIKLWEAGTGKLIRTLEGHINSVTAVALSGDGKTVVSGSQDSTVKLWEAGTGKLIRTLEGHWSVVTAIALLPIPKTIVSASTDRTVKLWDVSEWIVPNASGGSSPTVFEPIIRKN